MKGTCFFVAAFVWASAFLVFQPCYADMLEITDRGLEEITGQAGSFIYAEPADGASNSGKKIGVSSREENQAGFFPWDFFWDDIDYAENRINMTTGSVPVEPGIYQADLMGGSAGSSELYGFIKYSGNVQVSTH